MAIKRWNSFVVGLVVPSQASIVCRRCSGHVKKIGYAAIAGFVAIAVVTLLFLDLVATYL